MNRKKEEKLTHKVFARVSEKKYEELRKLVAHTRCRTLGELIRNILMEHKIVVETYDATAEKVMAELGLITSELKRIGTNINQVTRRLNQENLPAAQRELLLNLAELQQQTGESVAGLFTTVAKLSEKWLPE